MVTRWSCAARDAGDDRACWSYELVRTELMKSPPTCAKQMSGDIVINVSIHAR